MVNLVLELLDKESGLFMLCVVIKSSIWEYYGDLDRLCGPEPRYSELKAEHEMRQRVKAHWDEQQHFLYPDYGRLSYTFRSRMQWLFGPLARTSALHSSVFLTALDRLENLVELKVSYSVPRDIPIVGTIAKDMSFGLGRYLAGSRGRRLKILRLELVDSSDLEVLLSNLCPDTPLFHQPPIETSMPGSWPLNECKRPPPSNVRLDLQLETLEIIFAHDDSPPSSKSSSLAEDLGRLRSYTGKLGFLELTCPFSYRITDLMPSLVGFRVPPLLYLTDVIMENMYVDSGALLSLLMHNQPSLKTLNILGVYLQGGTWAEIGKALAREKSLECLKFDRQGYLGSDGELRGLSAKDWMFWEKC
ncbi:hypothetical protein G7Y79_00032g067730 [Physcia stellaris]|nr:hypothetical protein G7Y79_00032g067730 [Physcia stellaris]